MVFMLWWQTNNPLFAHPSTLLFFSLPTTHPSLSPSLSLPILFFYLGLWANKIHACKFSWAFTETIRISRVSTMVWVKNVQRDVSLWVCVSAAALVVPVFDWKVHSIVMAEQSCYFVDKRHKSYHWMNSKVSVCVCV